MGSVDRTIGTDAGCVWSRRLGPAGGGVVIFRRAKSGEMNIIGAPTDQAADPTVKHGRVEVDEQPDIQDRQLQVGQHLRLMERQQMVDGL